MTNINAKLSYRKATIVDLPAIIELLADDELGATREAPAEEVAPEYKTAFDSICVDPNQHLLVVELGEAIVGTCHLTIMPSLTFKGTTRMQIEAVRVASSHRGQQIGTWMLQQAITYGKKYDVGLIQLSTNTSRPDAKEFYEALGFTASHHGMKLFL